MQRVQIAEHVYLNCIQTDKFKCNYFTMNFITPLREQTAACHALLPMLLRRGCKEYPDILTLSERLQSLYNASLSTSYNFKRGEMQIVGQSAWMLDNSLIPDGTDVVRKTLETAASVWFSPLVSEGKFNEEYLSLEKRSLGDAIRAKINNKGAYAATRLMEEMFSGEPYAVPETGTLPTLENVTAAGLYDIYRNILDSAPCEMYYIGLGDITFIADIFGDAFSNIQRNVRALPKTEILRSAQHVREFAEAHPTGQSRLCLGFRSAVTEADGYRPALLLFNEIYGSGMLSKLFMNVREKLSLCYSCSSGIDQHKGIMAVYCGIDSANKDAAQSEILKQLEDVKSGCVTDAEFTAAKHSLCSSLRQIEDEPDSIAMWSLGRRLAGNPDTLDEEIEKIRALSLEDVVQVACGMSLDTVYFLKGGGKDPSDDGDETEVELDA